MARDLHLIRGVRRCRAIFGLAAIAALAAALLHGQGTSAKNERTFSFDSDSDTFFQWHNFPRWNGGLLAGYISNFSSAPVIVVIDRDGRREETLFTLPDGARINIVSLAISPDGEIAVVGSAQTADQRGATFLARIARDRRHQTVTRLWPYVAAIVSFAPDGTIWTVGDLKDEDNTTMIAYNVLRRFDRAGKMLGSTTLRMKTTKPQETSYFFSSRDRVGWFSPEREYLEFSLDGSEMGRYDWPEQFKDGDISGVALSEQNDAVAGWFANRKIMFFALDRATGTWNKVSLPADDNTTWARVVGFDGTMLVTDTTNGTLRRFKTQ